MSQEKDSIQESRLSAVGGRVGVMGDKLTVQEFLDAGLDDWRRLAAALHARFTTADFAKALAFVNAIGEAAEEMNHHPDIDLRWGRVDVKTWSHDVSGITDRDVQLARRITEIAKEMGVEAHPDQVQVVELALDTADYSKVKPFWRAVLGMGDGRPGVDDEIIDPTGVLPSMWFQGTEPHETPRQRFHLDIWVPHDEGERRIAAALEAGGTMVSDAEAPSFTVLADEDGNKACVCTILSRG
jgi:4a-hydroxytetrahydrobiopterin dehydratase